MTKFKKILSSVTVGIVGLFALASCGSTSFYSEWSAAGATIEEDNVYKVLTLDEVKTMRENKDDFLVMIGASNNSDAVSKVSQIQAEADNINYDGALYFVNVKDILPSLTQTTDAINALGVHSIDAGSKGLIAVCYDDGGVKFDTSSEKENDLLDRFKVTGSSVDFIALADYAFELYPVEK